MEGSTNPQHRPVAASKFDADGLIPLTAERTIAPDFSNGPRGRLISLCGLNGCGKSTQIGLLKDHLDSLGHDALVVRNHTFEYKKHPDVLRMLRLESTVDLITLALLSAADTRRIVVNQVAPALASGRHVIMDRYIYSTVAYFNARGVDDALWLESINAFLPRPDLAIYLDVDPEVAVFRVISRGSRSPPLEERNVDRLRKVRACFGQLARRHQLAEVDGEAPVQTVSSRISRLVESILESGARDGLPAHPGPAA